MRKIDGDALFRKVKTECNPYGKPTIGFEDGKMVLNWIEQAPIVGGWISVKKDLPKEHDSIFAHMPLVKGMWAKESDDVIVYVRFPDGTGRATEGRLQDGKWWTRISRKLEPVVTHWMPMPGEPKEAIE